MAILIGVFGPPGSGKTTSVFPYVDKEEGIKILGLNPKSTVFVNVSSKPLPPGAYQMYGKSLKDDPNGNYLESKDYATISKVIKHVGDNRPDVQNIVIDDYGYLGGTEVVGSDPEGPEWGMGRTDGVFKKWRRVAYHVFHPLNVATSIERKDLNIIFMFHDEMDSRGVRKILTQGKMIDNNVPLDGLFSYLFLAQNEGEDLETGKPKYSFKTNVPGTTSKSVIGVFKRDHAYPNDLGVITNHLWEQLGLNK